MFNTNDVPAILVGILLGLTIAGIAFLIAVRLNNIRKNGERSKRKSASTQRNIGNRIYRALCHEVDGTFNVKNVAHNGEFGHSVLVWYGSQLLCKVNIDLKERIPISVNFHQEGTSRGCENMYGSSEQEVNRLLQFLLPYIRKFVASKVV